MTEAERELIEAALATDAHHDGWGSRLATERLKAATKAVAYERLVATAPRWEEEFARRLKESVLAEDRYDRMARLARQCLTDGAFKDLVEKHMPPANAPTEG